MLHLGEQRSVQVGTGFQYFLDLCNSPTSRISSLFLYNHPITQIILVYKTTVLISISYVLKSKSQVEENKKNYRKNMIFLRSILFG